MGYPNYKTTFLFVCWCNSFPYCHFLQPIIGLSTFKFHNSFTGQPASSWKYIDLKQRLSSCQNESLKITYKH